MLTFILEIQIFKKNINIIKKIETVKRESDVFF